MTPRRGNPTVIVFAMPPVGHFQRLRAVIGELADGGFDVVVATHDRFAADVAHLGARFFDLFTEFPLDGLDDDSSPPPVRFVTYAGTYGEAVAERLRLYEAQLVLYDTFAVVGRAVGAILDLPAINICSGHDRVPERVTAGYRSDPRVRVSAACRAAVETLRHDYGLTDASHLSWVTGVSSYLNIYCEPEAYLSIEGKEAFAPITYFGSLCPDRRRASDVDPWGAFDRRDRKRVFVCLGSVAWRLFHECTRSVLEVIVESLATHPELDALVSLGAPPGEHMPESLRSRENVIVHPWIDQWAALEGADVFVTHAGLNSVHEAIYLGVPMVAYPIFADHPSLTEIGVASNTMVRLVEPLRGPVTANDVDRALREVDRRSAELTSGLSQARALELDVMAGRAYVIERVRELARLAESVR